MVDAFMRVSQFSPRMWRCFYKPNKISLSVSVFSTYVEVFLAQTHFGQHRDRFLHVCGGVSGDPSKPVIAAGFSPRMWRCFHSKKLNGHRRAVFSTYVEVFPLSRKTPAQFCVFSTYVEVFPSPLIL